MKIIILIIFGFLLLMAFTVVELRYFVFHFPQLCPLIVYDLLHIEKPHFDKFGIDMYCGYMGEGKTIKAVDTVLGFKKRFPYINVYSNIHIACDYLPIHSYRDLIDAPPNSIFLIDECSTLFHSRDWKSFPTDLIQLLFQTRKQHKYLILTAQRFHHVDKTIRDITNKVYQQKHCFWRIHTTKVFDAWDLENSVNINDLKPEMVFAWHRTNQMYKQYNTDERVLNSINVDYISNDEILNLRGQNLEQISNSRKNKKALKNNQKNITVVKTK